MDHPARATKFADDLSHDYLHQPSHPQPSAAASLLYTFALLYLLALYFNYPLPGPHELPERVCDVLVDALPARLLLPRGKREELKELRARGMFAHVRAVKKEALRGMIPDVVGKVLKPGAASAGASMGVGVMRRTSFTSVLPRQDVSGQSGGPGGVVYPNEAGGPPPGLGNWDNSCYQNCILQGLASLDSLQSYLQSLRRFSLPSQHEVDEETTGGSLLATINKLKDSKNNGRLLWTPARLKKMSSWQQQDAQEYLSKILEEVEKEAAKAFAASSPHTSSHMSTISLGLPALITPESKHTDSEGEEKDAAIPSKSPLDGLLAQKVTCTSCGFSDGLGLIPFNCLTLPLSTSDNTTDIAECLDEYTKLEEISEVECAKCTLLRAERRLESMLPADPNFRSTDTDTAEEEGVERGVAATERSQVLKLPPELRARAFHRLHQIRLALSSDDFSDKTLTALCPSKSHTENNVRVHSTKTRQAVIARPPHCLVVHVNRSVFDEGTGWLRKNYARVGYPLALDLGGWMLEDGGGGGGGEDEMGGESVMYQLKAVVTHFGRHENGHYICYRGHGHSMSSRTERADARREGDDEGMEDDLVELEEKKKEQWWRLSDEDVSPVEEEDVLGQGGVFMLFYERMGGDERPPRVLSEGVVVETADAAAIAAMTLAEEEDAVMASTEEEEETRPIPLPQRPDHETEEPPATPSSTTDPDRPSISGASSPLEPPSTEATTEDEAETDFDDEQRQLQKSVGSGSPLRMRTARLPDMDPERERGLGGNGFRAVAAT